MKPLVAIGLDDHVVERIASVTQARVISYPAPPQVRVQVPDGRVLVESQRAMGLFIEPAGIIYYSYFDGAQDFRRTLALSSTPTFPDVRATLAHDDKILSLVMASYAESRPLPDPVANPGFVWTSLPRTYLARDGVGVWHEEHVAKWGNSHCGDNKERIKGATFVAKEPTVVEPFVEGESVRILIVGEHYWQIRYESEDWRKNVSTTRRVVEANPDMKLVARALRTSNLLGLDVVGIDYIVPSDGSPPKLLEVNAYPDLDCVPTTDLPGAVDVFAKCIADWWAGLDK